MKKVLVTGSSITSDFLDKLRTSGFDVENRQGHLSEDEVIRALKGKHAYLLGGLERATTQVLEHARSLRLIAFLGVGYQSFIDYETATRLGIAITNTPGTFTDSVVELTIGHLIGLRRWITYLNNQAKAGETIEEKSVELRGQVVGIIGMGTIGTRIAEILVHGLGMKVIYYSRSPKPLVEQQLNAIHVSLEELLTTSDIVTLHCPLTPETKNMIGAVQLSLMKPQALLINTARAEVIDGHALYQALASKKLGGAAFDGYYREPIPSPSEDKWKLLSLPDNIFTVTPHIASLTENARSNMAALSISSIISFFQSGDDMYIVNPQFRKR